MSNSEPLLGPGLVVVCVVMAVAAGLVSKFVLRGSLWPVPRAAVRAAVQLAAVATVLAAAMSRLWSSVLVLMVMFAVAAVTAARRSEADRGSLWLALSLAVGMAAVIPLLLLSGVVPLTGVALVPVFGIVLGGTMTAAAVAARRALDALSLRWGEVEAALSLGLSERDSRMEVIERPLADALLPNLDQARTAGLVTLPGAFVGVLLATGSAAQAGAVQVMVLVSLLLAQACGVAVTGEMVARGRIARSNPVAPKTHGWGGAARGLASVVHRRRDGSRT
ncbi:ABC transporter permease [Mycolicibacterium sp. P1-18]|uniref:ABC transporter permease n=1 Tax=Mycolicibacterium sp. P1-18 TaxID=2024615 RepID=UPI0021059E53|nr:ABC transporter permease [Mycolicibacterium sp. P1-18]